MKEISNELAELRRERGELEAHEKRTAAELEGDFNTAKLELETVLAALKK